MYCMNCRKKINYDARYCPYCGNLIYIDHFSEAEMTENLNPSNSQKPNMNVARNSVGVASSGYMQDATGSYTQNLAGSSYTQNATGGNYMQNPVDGTYTQSPAAGAYTQDAFGGYTQAVFDGAYTQNPVDGSYSQNFATDYITINSKPDGFILSKKEFYKREEVRPLINKVNSSAFICFFAAACTFLVMLLSMGLTNSDPDLFSDLGDMASWWLLLDVGFLIIMGVLIKIKKSFSAAIILLVYAALSMGVSINYNGQPGGWLVLIAAVLAVVNIWKLRKAWKEYQTTGVIPIISVKKK